MIEIINTHGIISWRDLGETVGAFKTDSTLIVFQERLAELVESGEVHELSVRQNVDDCVSVQKFYVALNAKVTFTGRVV